MCSLLAGAALLAAAPAPQAEGLPDDLIRQITAGARTDAERAEKLYEAAQLLKSGDKTRLALLAKAVEHGMKGLASAACRKIVAKSLDLLHAESPDGKDEWTLKKADVLRARYRASRTQTSKRSAGEELVAALLAAGGIHEKNKDWAAAAAVYREANLVTTYLKLPAAKLVLEKRRAADHLAGAGQKAARYAAALQKDPAKTAFRILLLKTLVVDLNDPEQANKHLADDVDETWRTYVPLACLPVTGLKEVACKELGDWYGKELARDANPLCRAALLIRAKAYYEQFLKLHTTSDLAAVTVKVALGAIEKELAQAAPSVIDLLGLVHPQQHKVAGTWTKKGGALAVASSSFARITVPVIPEGSYELKLLFVRGSGREVVLMLPVGPGAVVFGLGLSISPVLRSVGSSSYYGESGQGRLTSGKEYAVLVQVAVQKDTAAIRIALNGKLALEWKGDPKTLAPYKSWQLPEPRTLGLGAYSAEVLFKRATLRMVSGRAAKPPAKD